MKMYFAFLTSSNSQSLSPPSGSLAYSLLSTSSEHDPPSTSGCSSDQSARFQTQKELMKAIKELKLRLPAERKDKSNSTTLSALKYALQCVRQVRGECPINMLQFINSYFLSLLFSSVASLLIFISCSKPGILPPVECGGLSWLQPGPVHLHNRRA